MASDKVGLFASGVNKLGSRCTIFDRFLGLVPDEDADDGGDSRMDPDEDEDGGGVSGAKADEDGDGDADRNGDLFLDDEDEDEDEDEDVDEDVDGIPSIDSDEDEDSSAALYSAIANLYFSSSSWYGFKYLSFTSCADSRQS